KNSSRFTQFTKTPPLERPAKPKDGPRQLTAYSPGIPPQPMQLDSNPDLRCTEKDRVGDVPNSNIGHANRMNSLTYPKVQFTRYRKLHRSFLADQREANGLVSDNLQESRPGFCATLHPKSALL
ncbi:hypothetical protein MK280_02105, partial [Myxococcota bacterium]|nr:hypothetical protein [Myxococcota bacterium]